ncbi:hypothetical protein OESDEN_16125, partial [Oesophagostomum dentatum]
MSSKRSSATPSRCSTWTSTSTRSSSRNTSESTSRGASPTTRSRSCCTISTRSRACRPSKGTPSRDIHSEIVLWPVLND